MTIAVIGLGYVGLCQALALDAGFRHKQFGKQIIGADIDKFKVESVKAKKIYIHEPGLAELMEKNEIHATTNVRDAINTADTIFVCVGTPENKDGTANLKYVYNVMHLIGECIEIQGTHKTIVLKSTVPPGTSSQCIEIIQEYVDGIFCDDFDFVMSPEFLREGSALQDIYHPDKVVIGNEYHRAFETVRDITISMIRGLEKEHGHNDLFSGYCLEGVFVDTNLGNAELIKYANNSFLAMKISFINMLSWACEKIPGGNIGEVAEAIGMDGRINPAFLGAGVGYGGSCFPKDIKALASFFRKNNLNPQLLYDVDMINEIQKDWAVDVLEGLDRKVGKIAIMGVAFKPNTDDIRDSAALRTILTLYSYGHEIVVHDPQAIENFNKEYPHISSTPWISQALAGAEVAIFLTDWDEYKNIDVAKMREAMKDNPVIIDGRRMFDNKWLEGNGFDYYGVGENKY